MKKNYFIVKVEGFTHRLLVQQHDNGSLIVDNEHHGVWGSENIPSVHRIAIYRSIINHLTNGSELIKPANVDCLTVDNE